MRKRCNETVEKYLEAILILSKSKSEIRSIDIARALGLSKSYVCTTMKMLREKQYITISQDGFVHLTDTGRDIAETVLERREVLHHWLIKLGVNEKTASQDAGRLKHSVSTESFAAIKRAFPD
jgi:Mn-dependent DtxR family transcriptional regulator